MLLDSVLLFTVDVSFNIFVKFEFEVLPAVLVPIFVFSNGFVKSDPDVLLYPVILVPKVEFFNSFVNSAAHTYVVNIPPTIIVIIKVFNTFIFLPPLFLFH